MPLSDTEFAAIMKDPKAIVDHIRWLGDEDNSPARRFRAEVNSNGGWSMFIQGHYKQGHCKQGHCNRRIDSLTYSLILRTEGRIFGLCLGKDHHNPQCDQVGPKHMHLWTQQHRDKEAYVPSAITAPARDPVTVWQQFCAAAGIQHQGMMFPPPAMCR